MARDIRSEDTVASYASAGVLHALPLYRTPLRQVHLTTPREGRISSGDDVFRHVHSVPDQDITEVNGIRCTTVERTVFDLCRTLSPEAALSVADAALRQIAVRDHAYDESAAMAWRDDQFRRLRDAAGARGIRQARRIVEIADGRAQLPGESVSRLQLFRLGFRHLCLQVPVRALDGRWYWVDIGIEEADAWGEFDGATKYLDEAMRSGRSVEEVLLAEKQREDWIRGTTHRRFARWGTAHIETPLLLGRRLASFGILPPR